MRRENVYTKFRIQFLKKLSLFVGVKSATLQKIASSLVERKIHNKDTVYFSGEQSEYLYIVRYGEVVVKINNTKSIYLGPGEILAEVSVITGLQHSSTATASMDCLIYEIEGKLFLKLAEEDRALSRNLIALVSDRFRENLTSKKLNILPKRLIAHIRLDAGAEFYEEVKSVTKICDESISGRSLLISAEQFQGLTPDKILVKLSDLRIRNSILHVRFDNPEKMNQYENIILQADYIVFYEKDFESGWNEKIHILNYWRSSLRNYQGRAIRFLNERSYSFRQGNEHERILTNIEFMARSLVSKTRGLTLGGGGARALAHVGLLKVLETNKIQFDYISGSSMGAVIAALYARGETAASIEQYIKKYFGGLDTPFDSTIPLIAFYKGKKMKKMLRDTFGDERIEDYRIPFVTSAVDIQTGEEYIFDKGPLWEALLCTMSLPAVFPPVFVGEHLLVDGGVLNNVPDDLIRNKGADTILSVNVSPLKDKNLYQLLEDKRVSGKSFFQNLWENIKYPPILKIMGRASMLEGREITKAKVSRMDLFLHFHLEEFNLFDFNKYDLIIKKGQTEAERYFKEINNLFFPN
jgi:NTE family protein